MVTRITHQLGKTARITCTACKGDCCRQIECQMYSKKFSTCPIYEIRPRECRYHVCNKVFDVAILSSEDKELLQKPIDELLHGEKSHVSQLFTQFPRFPLDSEGLTLLGIQEEVHDIIMAFEAGRIEEKHSRILLKNLFLRNSAHQIIQSFTRE